MIRNRARADCSVGGVHNLTHRPPPPPKGDASSRGGPYPPPKGDASQGGGPDPSPLRVTQGGGVQALIKVDQKLLVICANFAKNVIMGVSIKGLNSNVWPSHKSFNIYRLFCLK